MTRVPLPMTFTVRAAALSLAASLLFGPALAGAQDAPEPRSASISGTVVDAEGTPLAGVTVVLAEIRATRVTDESGAYAFSGLSRGIYSVQARSMGFLPVEHRIEIWPAEQRTLDFVLDRHPLLLDAILVEIPDGGLRGVVHDAALRPIPGAEVSPRVTTQRFRTGEDGWFSAPDLGPGRHLLRVSASGFEARFFSVVIPEDSARVVSIQLHTTTERPATLEARDWRDYSRLVRWGSGADRAQITREDLDRHSAGHLLDIGEIRSRAGTDPCVRVNGRPTVLPLEHFHAFEVEAVDVFPQDALFFERPPLSRRGSFMSRSLGPSDAARERCTSQVWIWLPPR